MPNIICPWSACKHNSAKKVRTDGNCSHTGAIRFTDCDFDEQEALDCMQFEPDRHKFE